MKNKWFLVLFFLLPFCCAFGFGYFPKATTDQSIPPRAHEILDKYNQILFKIKDATADITLDTTLNILGCSGLIRQQGKGFFKAPDKLRADTIEHNTFFVRGNYIRKIDEQGKRFYISLLYSLDFSVGFNANLISQNFYLTVLKDAPDEIILKGLPKPGVLKNTREILLYFNPNTNLLDKIDVVFNDKKFNGTLYLNYKKMGDNWVPVGFQGTTAVELQSNIMVGLGIRFEAKNIKLNPGLSDQIFNPGF